MTDIAVAPQTLPQPIAIPLRAWAPWAIFGGVMMLFLLYIVGLRAGRHVAVRRRCLHEWVHDARHLLGFPCH